MIKPATPLAVLFLVAFVLLLLPTLSVPLIKSIPLASATGINNVGNFDFGIFGWCGPHGCSGYQVGYSTDNIPGFDPNGELSLPGTARTSLSSILVVHPIAALLALVCAGLAIAAHFRAAGHSPKFLLGLLIFTFPTLLIALLAFLVDILLFVPNQRWATYLQLAGTIVITICSVLTCAMRRTLVSRKARQKRIAENADMNGDAYYANKPQAPVFNEEPDRYVRESTYARAESPPPLDANMDHKLPQTAAFESADDRTPLNAREPSVRTVSTQRNGTATDGSRTMVEPAPGAMMDAYGSDRPRSPVSPLEAEPPLPGMQRGPPGPRGGYPAAAPRGGRGGMPPPMFGRGRGGYPPPRGGYGPRGRGAYPPPPGPYGGRAGFFQRGAYRGGPRGPPPPGMRGGYMGPAAGYMGRGGRPGESQMPPSYPQEPGYEDYIDSYVRDEPQTAYADAAYDHRPSPGGYAAPVQPDGYGAAASPYAAASHPHYPPQLAAQTSAPGSAHGSNVDGIARDPASFGFSGPRGMSPARAGTPVRSASPPPPMPTYDGHVGQAIEMDAMPRSPPAASASAHAAGGAEPVEIGSSTPRVGQAVPVSNAAAELPGHMHDAAASVVPPEQAPARRRKSSEVYYEDVDPRFAQDEPLPVHSVEHPAAPLPGSLVPGYVQNNPANAHLFPTSRQPSNASSSYSSDRHISNGAMHPSLDDSDPLDRTRSPAHSDTSNFTSISQRGVNPNWRPAPGDYGPAASPVYPGPAPPGVAPRSFRGGPTYGAPPPRGRAPPPADVLGGNPDFALPGAGRGRAYHHAHNSSDGGRYPAPGAL